MKAMIFAAGLGKRLGSITSNIPKVLVKVKGRSILRIAVEKAASHGFDDIIINIHHFAEMVEHEIYILRSEGYRITVSDERDSLLETGGGLFKARWFFDERPFLLYNADILTDLNLNDLYNFHAGMDCLVTLATRKRTGKRFILVDNDGILRGWRNISTGEEIITAGSSAGLEEIGFSGIHIADPSVFNYMHEGKYSLIELYLKLAANHKIITYRHDSGKWWDVGNPESLKNARISF